MIFFLLKNNWDWSFQLRLGSVSGIKNVKQKIKTRVKNLIQEYGGKIKIWNILESFLLASKAEENILQNNLNLLHRAEWEPKLDLQILNDNDQFLTQFYFQIFIFNFLNFFKISFWNFFLIFFIIFQMITHYANIHIIQMSRRSDLNMVWRWIVENFNLMIPHILT